MELQEGTFQFLVIKKKNHYCFDELLNTDF